MSDSPTTPAQDLGVSQVADELNNRLQRYIETQYHIRDSWLVEERRALLQEPGTIGQRPFLETTASYARGQPYSDLGLPHPIGETLSEVAAWTPGIGVFPQPYVHQAEALQGIFQRRQDVVVATGTGSGKTETFLLPILGQLVHEAATRPASFAQRGMRALLLYPMNALVADQVSRLRRLFGDERLAGLFRTRYGRTPQFGMYTGRTPYAGTRTSEKDERNLARLLRYYIELEQRAHAGDSGAATLVEELRSRGRWPAKDLAGFLGATGTVWHRRLQTQPGDRELLTRHEMHKTCPDLLVTNYSMLEYMLLRPIERSIFKQTRDWLASDSQNELTLVVDEAHMYRGVGGAEVALLIRRLQARLGISRDRMRCILTSASLGTGPEAEAAAINFAAGLTGRPQNRPSFAVIRGQREARPHPRPGTAVEAAVFADFPLAIFHDRVHSWDEAVAAINSLAGQFGWSSFPQPGSVPQADELRLRETLYDHLYGFGPIELLIERTTGHATPYADLSSAIFPNVVSAVAEQATAALLALGTYARHEHRALLPTRAHLLFRGLPGIFACINPRCDARRVRPGVPEILGRLFTEARTNCTCTQHARVYEVFAHRTCGAVFLRVFGQGPRADFYWHERGGSLAEV